MIAMDLPEAKGTYVLIAFVAQMKRLEIGRLGAYDIVPGYYAYVGSAFGAGGLRARISHHLESTASPHWLIDYLLAVAEPVQVWSLSLDRRHSRRKGSRPPRPQDRRALSLFSPGPLRKKDAPRSLSLGGA